MARPTGAQYAAAAMRYVGVREQFDGKRWTNRQQFGKRFGWDGVPWCMIFAWCIADELGAGRLVPRTASCAVAVQWFKRRGAWYHLPRVGDLIFFGFAGGDHVGIVTRVTDQGITYVSGNSSDGTVTGDTGNAVTLKTVRHGTRRVHGFGRPKWAPEQKRNAPIHGKTRRVVTVKRGQTLAGIAAAAGITLAALLMANPDFRRNPDLIHPGDRVTIPARPSSP